MNQLENVFNYQNQQVRTLIKEGEPWFVAKDVCDILELSNPTVAVQRLDTDEVTKFNLGGLVGETNLVNEAGLYSLILASRKKEAKAFKRWVTHEVLPQIRKTGRYGLPKSFAEALRLAADLEEEKQKLLPKAQYFDALVERNLLTNFRDTAKELKVKEQEFITWLINNKYIYRDQKKKLRPFSKHVPNLFEVKEYQRENWASVQTLITPKGRETFRLLIKERVSV